MRAASGVDLTAWGPSQRRRLRTVRARNQQTQAACAAILRREFAVAAASQVNVARWEKGSIKRPGCAPQLVAYCDTYEARVDVFDANGSEVHPESASEANRASESDGEAFEMLAGRLTGEPLLGPRQAELVRAVAARIRSGPPLSEYDHRAIQDQFRLLNL